MDTNLLRKLMTSSIIAAAKVVQDDKVLGNIMAQKPFVVEEGTWSKDGAGTDQLVIEVPTNVTSPMLFIVPASTKLKRNDGTKVASKTTIVGYAKVGSFAENDFLRKDNGVRRLMRVKLVLVADKFDHGYLVAMKFRSQSTSDTEPSKKNEDRAITMPIIPKT